MSKKSYPRIIEMKKDGRIIAKDKYNKLNTELNIHTLTYKQQEEVFGGILINDFNKNDDTNKYYNERDFHREKELEEEIKKKKTKGWLSFIAIILLIIVVILIVKSCSTNSDPTNQNTGNTTQDQTQQTQQSLSIKCYSTR
jgi:hypothetical protein